MATDAAIGRVPATQRVAWLDALRGIAALAVVADHLSQWLLKDLRPHIYSVLDLGNYGVFVFFLISGYIVPSSLERKGSVRTFWVSRVFRLYPMYLIAVSGAVALWLTLGASLDGADRAPAANALAQLLMMSNVLGGTNVPNVVWSLTYEMVFYLLLTALFVVGTAGTPGTTGAHKRSAGYALVFGCAALLLGGVLPQQLLTAHVGAVLVAGRGWLRLAGGWLAGGVALLLLTVNSNADWPYRWEGMTILGLMFTGTALYRAERGECRWRTAITVAASTLALNIAAGVWHSHAWHLGAYAEMVWARRWVITLIAAGLTFAAGLAVRHWVLPRWLTWLGLISYSVYLLHPLLIPVWWHYVLHGHHFGHLTQAALFAAFIVIVVVASSVTYLVIEKPTQALGRRVSRSLDARFGPDRARPDPVVHPGPRDSAEVPVGS